MMRREIPLIITFIAGFVQLVDFFVPHPWVANAASELRQWSVIVIAASIVLGIGNLLRIHLFERIPRRTSGWQYSIVLLAGMFAMAITGLAGGVGEGTSFNYLFRHLKVHLDMTMFALLAFFIASAAYRAFRVRNWEATLLLLAAVIVMLGRVPLGSLLTRGLPTYLQLPVVTEWIMNVPNMIGFRGIMMGAAMGVMAMGLRIILGIERAYLGGE
jgi:hypothetical protein